MTNSLPNDTPTSLVLKNTYSPGIVNLTLNNPSQYNALSEEMLSAMMLTMMLTVLMMMVVAKRQRLTTALTSSHQLHLCRSLQHCARLWTLCFNRYIPIWLYSARPQTIYYCSPCHQCQSLPAHSSQGGRGIPSSLLHKKACRPSSPNTLHTRRPKQ